MIKLEIMEQKKLKYGASLKYLSNFWRTLEMCLINYEINLIWTCSANCVTVSTDVANQGATFILYCKGFAKTFTTTLSRRCRTSVCYKTEIKIFFKEKQRQKHNGKVIIL